uniref:Vacuolar ATP synthase subunit F n=1 Tax=Arundo donax TaxID=35708 RepID=A0A0A9DJJ5_ARUDO
MAGRANIPTNNSALIAIIADEVTHPTLPPFRWLRHFMFLKRNVAGIHQPVWITRYCRHRACYLGLLDPGQRREIGPRGSGFLGISSSLFPPFDLMAWKRMLSPCRTPSLAS